MKSAMKKFIKNNFFRVLLLNLVPSNSSNLQKSPEYIEWRHINLVDFANEFTKKQNLANSSFIKMMNRIFRTSRFELLLKRWLVEYLYHLFGKLYENSHSNPDKRIFLSLEDNPINRFGLEAYCLKFGDVPGIHWIPQFSRQKRIISIFTLILYIVYHSINSGIRLFGRKKKFKVMREALWGLNGGGYFFHDDFLIDGIKIKKDDLLFFSRATILWETGRMRAYQDIRNSDYANFYLPSLGMGLKELLLRIFPKYIIQGNLALFYEVNSENFALLENILYYFVQYALPYEKFFSNFKISSELGHNFFSASHIAESIICQNYGVRYYLMQLSDISMLKGNYMHSFLGCDHLLLWGKAHILGVEGAQSIFKPTGYVFKNFIKQVRLNREKVLSDMEIKAVGKIITFFDESCGGECKMTESHYLNFWETALRLAQEEKENTIVVKPKEMSRYLNLSPVFKDKFIKIKNTMESMDNIYIIDETKWSFIEAIGISDIVINQGMTSSATIALICGIEGLYLDEANYNHPFARIFKDKIVFDNSDKLLDMVSRIIRDKDSGIKCIPESLIRQYDEFADDRGIDIFRRILSGCAN